MKSRYSWVISSGSLNFAICNTEVRLCSRETVLCISSQELLKPPSHTYPETDQMSKFAPNECHSSQDVTNHATVMSYISLKKKDNLSL
jgi:hypothetical protein